MSRARPGTTSPARRSTRSSARQSTPSKSPSEASRGLQNGHRNGGAHDSEFRMRLLEYKYVAPSLSFLERAYLDRFWDFMARRVYPRWLAPNAITLSGGVCLAVALGLTVSYSPSLRGEAPGWVYLLQALLFFVYQTLDGSDGKQARRTQSGSPMGELMDHGVDAWAVGAISIFVVDGLGLGIEHSATWLVLLGTQACFYTSNLTLLHSGKLRITNLDVMELQTYLIGCLVLTGLFSVDLFRAPCTSLPIDLTIPALDIDFRDGFVIGKFLVVFHLFGMLNSMVGSLYSIFDVYRSVPPSQQPAHVARHLPGTGLGAAMQQWFTLLSFDGLAALTYLRVRLLYSGLPPAARPVLEQMLLLLMLLLTSAFAELTSALLVLRIGQRRMPHVIGGLTCLLPFILSAQAGSVPGCAAACCLAVYLHLRYVYKSISDVADALGLHVFRVKGARSWRYI